ncbi:winged helix-turn-helix transcriptional regulator [Streptomyces sioyaensis]|uniref:winged helix-turn-helix transcriptional regulator n=1 Tax=Streptomyces sioyaensis TaxID=67364 RepID=UPI003D73B61F
MRTDTVDEACPTPDSAARQAALASAFAVLGKPWSGLLIGALLAGPSGFARLSRAVAGISDRMLSTRLRELAAAGIVHRVVDEEPSRHATYVLTPRGQALGPALDTLARWGEGRILEGEPLWG